MRFRFCASQIITGYLRPTPTDYLPIFSKINYAQLLFFGLFKQETNVDHRHH